MPRRRHRWLVVVALLLGAPAAIAAPVVYRATLDGKIGALLTIDPEGKRPGTVRYDASGADGLVLAGTGGGADGAFEWKESLQPRDGQEKPTGVFRGTMTDGGRRGSGEWRSPDGKKTRPLVLERVARVERRAAKGIDAAVEYPVFDATRLARLNEQLSAEASAELSRLERAVRESRRENEAAGVSRAMLEGLSEQRLVDVESAGPDTVSLLWTHYSNTGGAHGNVGLSASNYAIGADGPPRPLGLWDVLAKSPPTVATLSSKLVADLKRQQASSVTDGQVKGFTQELESAGTTVTIVPAGLAFHFDPYAVGSYAEGTFRVLLPSRVLAPFARPGGPLDARPPTSPRAD